MKCLPILVSSIKIWEQVDANYRLSVRLYDQVKTRYKLDDNENFA